MTIKCNTKIELLFNFLLNFCLNDAMISPMKGGVSMRKFTTAQRLQQIMEERNLKQVDILRLAEPYSDMFGTTLTKSALNQYISGATKDPRSDKMSILSYALGVSEAWLMGFDVPIERTTPIPGDVGDGRKARVEKLFDRLSESDQDEIISLIEWKLSRK